MLHMLRHLALAVMTVPAIACAGIADGPWDTITDPNSEFSISVPSRWAVKTDQRAGYSEVIASSSRGPAITVLITSRPLSTEEKAVPVLDLVDAMMNSSADGLKQEGNTILEIGEAEEMVPGDPTFVIVSATEDGEHIVTSWGTVSRGRNYSITALTENREASDELAETLRRVVESFQIVG